MSIIDSSTFYANKFIGWNNIEIAGGPIAVNDCKLEMGGSGILIDQLGFIRSFPITTSTGIMFQYDFRLPKGPECICLGGISLQSSLSSTNSVSVLFNTFLDTPGFSGNIRLNDYGQDEVDGGTPVEVLTVGAKYRAKLLINSDGTVTGYIDAPQLGINNQSLGTTTVATDLNNASVYFQTNQTFISTGRYTEWTNYYVHDEGLSFTVPERDDANLCSHDYALKENYV